METSDIIGLAVTVIAGLGLIGLSVPLLMGKCAGLIAGYNTMTKEERESWDGPALARLELEPLIHGRLALGEGTGAVLLFPLLDMAEAVPNVPLSKL